MSYTIEQLDCAVSAAVRAEREKLERLKDHVYLCPIGWHNERLLKTRMTTEADIIKWVQELRALVGIPHPQGNWIPEPQSEGRK